MLKFKLDLTLDRDTAGRIIGFTVLAQKQAEAECFCTTFPGAFAQKRATFFPHYGVVFLENLDCSCQPGKTFFGLQAGDFVEFEMLYLNGGKFTIHSPAQPNVIGFRVVHCLE